MNAKPELPLISEASEPKEFSQHVFICGLHRSGTTLLESIMQASFPVAVLRAPVPENEGQHLQNVYPQAFRHGGPGAFAFAPNMAPPAPEREQAKQILDTLLRQWTPWVSGDSTVLLEKSPPNLTKIAWLRAVFPGAKFVVLTRDPRATAMATKKWSKKSINELVYHWIVAHSIASDQWGEDCHHVKYEDLCENLEGTISHLSEFLGLPHLFNRDSLKGRFSKLRNSNDKYLKNFPRVNTPSMPCERFGYEFGLRSTHGG